MKKNNMMICGRKISTLPTPANTPLTSKSLNKLAGNMPPSEPAAALTANLIASIGHCAQAKTAWNTRNRIDRENQRAEHRVQDDRIDAIAERNALRLLAADRPQYPAHFGLVPFDLLRGRPMPHRRLASAGRRRDPLERFDQRTNAARLDADGFDHRHAQLRGQSVRRRSGCPCGAQRRSCSARPPSAGRGAADSTPAAGFGADSSHRSRRRSNPAVIRRPAARTARRR